MKILKDNQKRYEIKFIINEKKYTFRASLPDYFKKMLKIKRLNFVN